MSIKEGNKALDFTLTDQKGEEVSLSSFAGKDIIIYFYPRDNTPGCTKEAIGFRDLWKEFKKMEAIIIGISPDKQAAHEKFIKEHELPFILLSDLDKKVMKEYGAFGEKILYGKKSMGVIRSTVWIGPDFTIKKHWKRVTKAADHPAQVCTLLSS